MTYSPVQPPSPRLFFEFEGVPRLFESPVAVVQATQLKDVIPVLAEVSRYTQQGYWAAGFICYEASPAFDSALVTPPAGELPLVWFGIFASPTHFTDWPPFKDAPFQLGPWQASIDQAQYSRHIHTIREAIAGGVTYQQNHTLRLRSHFSGSDVALYHQLSRAQQAAYMAYVDIGRHRILSASPELFFSVTDHKVTTRPMKGTTARGRTLAEDEAKAAWLQASAKNKAENVMIVDLLRNDLGRIAQLGSVNVEELFTLETYRTFHTLTSSITATLRPEVGLADILQALFPCGSVTGAPKVSTMGLIAQLEPTSRGIYCGTLGFITPTGNMIFNVPIRTLTLDTLTGNAEYGVGGGITWDSDASEEFEEAQLKASVLTHPPPEFELLESLRLEDGRYRLLDAHMTRLVDSAKYFQIPLSINSVRATLKEHAEQLPKHLQKQAHKVRLLVDRQGNAQVESAPLMPSSTFTLDKPSVPGATMTAALSPTPISSQDSFFFHKTTLRSMYEKRLTAARASHTLPLDDVLLVNEQLELTEFTRGNLILEMAGALITPHQASGLLWGAFVATLCEQGRVTPQAISVKVLEHASDIWFVNSVRGWIRVCLTT